MKKKIIIISVVLIGFVLVVTANSWAQSERGGERHRDRAGHFKKWDKPAVRKFDRSHGGGYYPKRYHHNYQPVHRFKPKFHRRQRPYYRHGHPGQHYWRHHRRPTINNDYSSTESYAAPEEEFHASASVSDSGFSVSIGVSKTN